MSNIRKIRFTNIVVLNILIAMCLFCVQAFAADGNPSTKKDLPLISVIHDNHLREVTLQEVYDFHGGPCPGVTMAYMAMAYSVALLHEPDEVPDVDDLIIVNRAPGGPMDLFDVVMRGGGQTNRTWPPAGMTRGADNFRFLFMRKSTLQAVDFGLREGLWPEDWFELRDKFRAGTITDAEAEKRKQDRQYVINRFPGKSYEELFGTPEVFTFTAWGNIEKGEMDRRIREQRRQARGQDRD